MANSEAEGPAVNLEVAPHGAFSATQRIIELQSKGVPCAFPNPSAIVSVEISLFEVAKPRTRPVESKTGPPEFPGFIAAVKVKVSEIELTEEIIPVVKIPEVPSGEPSTPTHHPCFGREPIH